ncbi:MAG: hypothetical protein ACRD9W_19350, partial [Terriglobia bacterium]
MAGRDGACADRRPYASRHRLQSEPVLVGRERFDRDAGWAAASPATTSAGFMEWPARPSGVVGLPAVQEEEEMDISVLGVDLGKNVCSVVGLDATGAV